MFDLRLQRRVRHELALELGDHHGWLEHERPVALLVHEVATAWTTKAGAAACIGFDDLIFHDHHITLLPQ